MTARLQQPSSGSLTLRALMESTGPEDYTLGRLSTAITHQACNPWVVLRIMFDYYAEMTRRFPDSILWQEHADRLIATEKRWIDQKVREA